MQKEIISGKQAMSILFLIITAVGIVNFTTIGNVNQDIWISAILAAFLVIPLFLIYCRLVKLFPNHGFFEIIEISFGRIGGKIITTIFIWYGLHTGALVMNHTTNFMKISTLPETPSLFIIIIITIICLIGLSAGLKSLPVVRRCFFGLYWFS